MPQTQKLPPLTQDLLDAFIASAALWLTRLLGAVLHPRAETRRKRLTAFVRHIERCVECIVFLQAVHAHGAPPPKRCARPRATPPGFRPVQRRFTLFWKIARVRAPRRASLVARLTRLFEVIARPARYIARFLKHLCKGLRAGKFIPVAPPAHALFSVSASVTAYKDTS